MSNHAKLNLLTVSQLNKQIRIWLEDEVGEVFVAGEISNVSKPSSGHYYFSLKDDKATIRCVFFRNKHTRTTQETLKDGQQVQLYGTLSLYEARGDYQLIVRSLEDAGKGDLYRQFEALKIKLANSGLFDSARKRTLPKFPQCIGVISSSSGAALQDILTTLNRRYPLATVLIYPSDVQGAQAVPQLINAIHRANRERRCEVIILARGGGSIEDLWAFNNEQLAHTIADSLMPIITGIGHETDVTIADFVADKRAATPTAAAELVTPDSRELLQYLSSTALKLNQLMLRVINKQQNRLQLSLHQLRSPKQTIKTFWQSLDYLEQRMHQAINRANQKKIHQLQVSQHRLQANNPVHLLQHTNARLLAIETRFDHSIKTRVEHLKQRLSLALSKLNTVSPLATLERGYAIVTHNKHIVLNSQQLKPGDLINIQLAKGLLACEVVKES